MTKDEVVQLMASSNSEAEWNANADKVKAACCGYPPFWWDEIIVSGLFRRTVAKWGGTGGLKLTVYDPQ